MPNQIEMFLMLFADDLALLSSTVRRLQNHLNLLYESSRRLGLKINTDKTKIMVFRKGGHLYSRENWYSGENVLRQLASINTLVSTFRQCLVMIEVQKILFLEQNKSTIEI